MIRCYGYAKNALLSALSTYIRSVVANPPDHVDSPEAMEDIVTEWLAEHGPAYRQCRTNAVVTLVRPYRSGYWPKGHPGVPCLRVFYEDMDGTSLIPVEYVGFREIE